MLYLISLSQQEIQTIATGLAELPYKQVVGLIANIQQQVRAIEAAAVATEKAATAEPVVNSRFGIPVEPGAC